MNQSFTSFDYLCNEPFYIEGIGSLQSPTLRDIRRKSYTAFLTYIHILLISDQDFYKLFNLPDDYQSFLRQNLSGSKQTNIKYYLLLLTDRKLLSALISFFIKDSVDFDEKEGTFHLYNDEEIPFPVGRPVSDPTPFQADIPPAGKDVPARNYIGSISQSNFNLFCEHALRILGLKKPDDKPVVYKSERARKLAEKISAAKSALPKQNNSLELDNMITKYCTHNKVGINIINVWELTYYQFIRMFQEYSAGRQADIHDSMACNTFSYSKKEDYNPMLWMEYNPW